MENHVIKIVTFKLADGVCEKEFIKTAPSVTIFLQNCKGFKRRCLSKGENDNWLEHVEWENMDDAKAASEAFMKQDSLMGYMQAIDTDSVKMEHQYLYLLASQNIA